MKKILFSTFLWVSFGFVQVISAQTLVPHYGVKIKAAPYHRLAVDKKGFTYVFSSFDDYEGKNYGRLLKLDQNGKRVEAFQQLFMDRAIVAVAVQADNKIIIAGAFKKLNGAPVKSLLRLNEDGTVDNTFISALSSGTQVKLQSDGKLIVLSNSSFYRLNTDGSIDNGFSFDNYVDASSRYVIGPDDEIYYSSHSAVFKLTKDGADDNSFYTGTGTESSHISAMEIQADGKIYVGGFFESYNGFASRSIVRLHPDGQVDDDFIIGTGPGGQIFQIEVRANGNILIGGQFDSYNNQPGNLIELKPDGSLHQNIAVVSPNNIESVVETPEGKIILGGEFYLVNGKNVRHTARFDAGNALDLSFLPAVSYNNPNGVRVIAGNNGAVVVSGQYDCEGVYSEGRLVKGNMFAVNRWGAYKAAYNDIGNPGFGRRHFFQDDGKIVVIINAFGATEKIMKRFNTDGSEDNSLQVFNKFTGSSQPTRVEVVYEYNGMLLVGGNFESYNSTVSPGLIALNKDGTINKSFNLPAGSNVTSINKQTSGRLILGGYFPVPGLTQKAMIRLNTDGSIDNTFASPLSAVYSVSIDEDDRIYFAGYAYISASTYYVGRLQTNGSLDPAFNASARVELSPNIHAIQALPGDYVAIGGYFNTFDSEPHSGLVIVDATGNHVDVPFEFGYSSAAVRLQYRDGALYAAGRFVNMDYTDAKGLIKINLGEVTTPAMPTDLKVALHSAEKFNVTWNDLSDDEFAFVLERSVQDADNFKAIDTLDANSTSFIDANREIKVKYHYRVRAVNDAGYSPYSAIGDFTWIPAPEGPINLTLTYDVTNGWILTWQGNIKYHDGFLVEGAHGSSNEFSVLSTVGKSVRTFTDPVKDIGQYRYRVTAHSDGGTLHSNISSVLITGTETIGEEVFSIYPIPASNHLYVQSTHSLIGKWVLVSPNGQTTPVSPVLLHDTSIIDLQQTPPGLYILQFSSNDGRIYKKRFTHR